MPVYSFNVSSNQALLLVCILSIIRYNSIDISREHQDHICLNIEPLLTTAKIRMGIWSKLPIGVMGQINLV